eukprot:g28883.t1
MPLQFWTPLPLGKKTLTIHPIHAPHGFINIYKLSQRRESETMLPFLMIRILVINLFVSETSLVEDGAQLAGQLFYGANSMGSVPTPAEFTRDNK